jgi:hypothetical protein
VAFGVRREEFAALQAWRRGGAEIEMVVICPELLLPATPPSPELLLPATSPTCCTGHDSVHPLLKISPTCSYPVISLFSSLYS